MKRLIKFLPLILLVLASCDRFLEFGAQETLDDFGDLRADTELAIEALLVDRDTFQYVRLSGARGLYDTTEIEFVDDAEVSVTDGQNTYDYTYIDTLDTYVARYEGIPDTEYTLRVEWRDKVYTASEVMADLSEFEIDSIVFRAANYDISHARFFDPEAPFRNLEGEQIIIAKDTSREVEDTLLGGTPIKHNFVYLNPRTKEYLEDYHYGDLFEYWFGATPYVMAAADTADTINVFKVYFFGKESKLTDNYYRFDVHRFGRPWLEPGGIITSDDNAIKENIENIEFPGYFVNGDVVDFYMFGISRRAYNFYISLSNVINSDGGGFSPPPGNPVTNIFDQDGNPGLGYFEVAKVAHERKVVKKSYKK